MVRGATANEQPALVDVNFRVIVGTYRLTLEYGLNHGLVEIILHCLGLGMHLRIVAGKQAQALDAHRLPIPELNTHLGLPIRMQIRQVPIGAGPERTPMEPLLAEAEFDGPLGTVESLPFVHTVARLDARFSPGRRGAAAAALATYRAMLERVGIDAEEPRPYNLLVTRDWMFLLPRTRGFFHSIEVNALGFAGALLVRNREQLAFLRREGPMTLLRGVGCARDEGH